MQTAISGHDLPQSGRAGFSGGQHGMPSAIAAAGSVDIVPAADVASGAVIMPTIARTGTSMRRMRQSFTHVICHTRRNLGS